MLFTCRHGGSKSLYRFVNCLKIFHYIHLRRECFSRFRIEIHFIVKCLTQFLGKNSYIAICYFWIIPKRERKRESSKAKCWNIFIVLFTLTIVFLLQIEHCDNANNFMVKQIRIQLKRARMVARKFFPWFGNHFIIRLQKFLYFIYHSNFFSIFPLNYD